MDYLVYIIPDFVHSCVYCQKTEAQRPGHNARLCYRMVRVENEKRWRKSRSLNRPHRSNNRSRRTAEAIAAGWLCSFDNC